MERKFTESLKQLVYIGKQRFSQKKNVKIEILKNVRNRLYKRKN